MNELINFEFAKERRMRGLERGGEPWVVAKDVADLLGYSDTQAMTRRLDDDEISTCTDKSSGQAREITIISESGLFNAILGSQKPEAKAFRKWVTSVVLPAIRKTGSFTMLKRSYESLVTTHLQNGNYRLRLLNLLDGLDSVFLENKGMRKSEYYKVMHQFACGQPVDAGTQKRLRAALDCQMADIIEWSKNTGG
jgi:prophage antirepressor-like protein